MTLGSSNSGAGVSICFNANGRIEVHACTTTATQIVDGVVYAESYGSLYKLLDNTCGNV